MKQYFHRTATVDGNPVDHGYDCPDDNRSGIEQGNRHYANMMQEVEAGDATITEVDETPVPTVDEKRREGYGPIGDQLDEIYHDFDAWKARIAQVKAANPK